MKKINEQTPLSRWISGHLPLKKGEVFKGGFTLIELLVVITIIGILTMVTVTSFVTAQKRSRDASKKAELKSLSDALSLYYADNGTLPTNTYINGLIDNEAEFSVGETIYMKKVPKDNSGFGKQITYLGGSKSYKLYANLENDKDIDCKSCLVGEYNVNGKGCCYVITSSNIDLNTTPLP